MGIDDKWEYCGTCFKFIARKDLRDGVDVYATTIQYRDNKDLLMRDASNFIGYFVVHFYPQLEEFIGFDSVEWRFHI